jgi:hypothetical protein
MKQTIKKDKTVPRVFVRSLLLAGLIGGSLCVPNLANAAERPLPAVAAKDLNERPFAFPTDTRGTPAIAVFAYRGEEQAEATRIMTMVARLSGANPGITVREFPVISVPRLAQGIINNGMRSGIPSVQTRGQVVTLYVPNMPAWRAATGFTDPRGVYVAIITPAGMKASIPSSQIRTDADLQRFIDANR